MQYSPTGFWARYKHPDADSRPKHDQTFKIPVERFTDEGDALIWAHNIDKTRLIRARALDAFVGLAREDRSDFGGRKLIGAVPAQPGWYVKTLRNDVHRVEVWGVLDDGSLVPADTRIEEYDDPRVLFMHSVDGEYDPDKGEKPSYTLHYQPGNGAEES
jgi:hypothetical protein